MNEIVFAEPDNDRWHRYDQLAMRCFGHPVNDITVLREHASARVALRGGRVVAGGLALPVPQFFGGVPVPSICLGAGCVAPEERGQRLAEQLMIERIAAARELNGAVLATLWTSSNSYARRLGWQAPVPVFSHTVTADDLRASFPTSSYETEHRLSAEAMMVQAELAADWNGPVQRPQWWWDWKHDQHSLTTYQFRSPAGGVEGVLSLATTRQPLRGATVVVHEFWAADADAATAMLAFLGRHHSRCDTVEFRRAALPPHPILLHGLKRHRVTAHSWHPWMLRLLDIPAALTMRGWPRETELTVTIDIQDGDGPLHRRYRFTIANGAATVRASEGRIADPIVRFDPRQLATWYAGGYHTTAAARFDGVHTSSDETLTQLVHATGGREPWLPDLF
jgi:predicted acetyltransferase